MLTERHALICFINFLLLVGNVVAAEISATPLVKNGSCPSGFSSSGSYCSPSSNARFVVVKVGNCPSGYSTSGNYCLANHNAKLAVPKIGSCPGGYSTSGDYCLSIK